MTENAPNSELFILKREGVMPRRERDRELARRRKRKKEKKKLSAKGLLGSPAGAPKEGEKKRPEKVVVKETRQEEPEKPASEG